MANSCILGSIGVRVRGPHHQLIEALGIPESDDRPHRQELCCANLAGRDNGAADQSLPFQVCAAIAPGVGTPDITRRPAVAVQKLQTIDLSAVVGLYGHPIEIAGAGFVGEVKPSADIGVGMIRRRCSGGKD